MVGRTNAKGAGGGDTTPKRYGYAVTKTIASPNGRFIKLFEASGLDSAYMDFATGEFNYGGFADLWFVKNNKPAMVKSDGTIDYYLDPNNYAFKEDGVTPSDIANTAYDGNAMSIIPTVWVKRWETTEYEFFVCCETQFDETYTAYAHTREDLSIMDYIGLSIYEGANISSKLRSLSGQTVLASTSVTTENTYATANGTNWATQSLSQIALICDLLRLMGGNDNSQATYGYGIGSGSPKTTGESNTSGQFFGYSEAQSKTSAVKVFHMENFWGNLSNRIAGLITVNGAIKVKPYPPYNTTGAGYTAIGQSTSGTTETYGGYSTMTAYGRLPYASLVAASATAYLCDTIQFNNAQTSYAGFGGYLNGTKIGFNHFNYAMLPTYTYTGLCARLSCQQPV